MFDRYFFPMTATLLLAALLLAALLLACGIYSSNSMNILFLGAAVLLGLVLVAYGLLRKKPASTAVPDVAEDEPEPEDVCLVIGPYVAKWFIMRNDESLLRYERQCLWLAARDAGELMKHLSRLYLQPQKIRISLFFPFLPDGHDTAALAISALMSWTKSLQSMVLPEPLPCTFAIYACFSQQRYGWDPDRVIWSGEELVFSNGVRLDEAIGMLLASFDKQSAESDRSLVQRHSTLQVLQQWFEDSQLLHALNVLFNGTAVSLTQCLLADYGAGFIRHGAWARWLEEQCGFLPALAKSRIELALPQILAPSITPAPQPVLAPAVAIERPRMGLLIPLMLGLVVGSSMLAASLSEKHRIEYAQSLIAHLNVLPDIDIKGKFIALDKVNENQQALEHCSKSFFFQNWGLADCDALLYDSKAQIEPYSPWVIYSSASSVSLFSSGNYEILPEQVHRLQPVAALVRHNPTIIFMIVGHSDNSGNEQQNIFLSQQRARAIRDWLINETHADAERFVLKGVGDAFPLMTNGTPEGREVNRRIDVIPLHPLTFIANESLN